MRRDREEDDLEDDYDRGARGRKVLTWVILIVIGLPILFYLFEYVVPRLLPANF